MGRIIQRPETMIRTVDPTVTPITLAEFKLHARVDIDDDDALCTSMIEAATDQCEVETERSLVTQTWQARFCDWSRLMALPRPPLQSVTAVEYMDEEDNWNTVAASNYYVNTDAEPAFIQFKDEFSFPSLGDSVLPVRITYVAGYGLAAAVPENAKRAIAILASHFYENRQAVEMGRTVNVIPRTFRSLVDSIRVPSLQ